MRTIDSSKRACTGLSWQEGVPAHWQPMRLKDTVEGCINGIWGGEPEGDGSDTPVIRVADFDRPKRKTFPHQTVRSVPFDQRVPRQLLPGDLLIEKSGGGELQPVGMVVEFEGESGAVCSNFVARMRPRDFVDGRFLIFLHAHLYDRSVTKISIKQSTGIQNLDSGAYLAERCFLPPLEEQRAISAYLDVETERIDGLIDEKRRLLNSLTELKSTRITEIVTGQDVASQPTGDVWLPKIPDGWSLKRLKYLGQVRSGLAKGKKNDAGSTTVERPYMRVANVQEGYIDLRDVAVIEVAENEVDRYALKIGDVLMNEGGDYDKVGRGAMWEGLVEECLHQNHVFAVRLDDIEWAPWLAAVTRTSYAKFYFMNNSKQSTNLASINQTNVKEFPVVLPPASKRDALLDTLTAELKRIDDLTQHVKRELDVLAEFRSATITDAVLGRLDVSHHLKIE
jgi:type I restriction enzyme S subunit